MNQPFFAVPLFNSIPLKDQWMPLLKMSPFSYILLLCLAILSCILFVSLVGYFWISKHRVHSLLGLVKNHIQENQWDVALKVCETRPHKLYSMIVCALAMRLQNADTLPHVVSAEKRRLAGLFKKRIAYLKDIAIYSVIVGLVGTLLGILFAFNEIKLFEKSPSLIQETIKLSMGSTFLGLVVSLFALLFYTVSNRMLSKLLNTLENETLSLGSLYVPNTHLEDIP